MGCRLGPVDSGRMPTPLAGFWSPGGTGRASGRPGWFLPSVGCSLPVLTSPHAERFQAGLVTIGVCPCPFAACLVDVACGSLVLSSQPPSTQNTLVYLADSRLPCRCCGLKSSTAVRCVDFMSVDLLPFYKNL